MTEKTRIQVEPGKPTIVMERVFDAPRGLVFEAWTNPEHLARWWGPRDLTLAVCEIDFRPGGAWRFVLRGRDGSDYGFGGEYREILPPERLSYTFRFDGAPDAEAVETLTFVEKDGKTTLTSTMVHTSVENRDAHVRSGMEEGALETMDRLAELLDAILLAPAMRSRVLQDTTSADPLSATFAALADPTRRAILTRLTSGEASVTELAEPFEMSLPAVSKHLKVLERAGLISRSRDAQWRPCRLDAGPLKEVSDWVESYRRFWEQSFERLDHYLRQLKAREEKRRKEKKKLKAPALPDPRGGAE